MESTQTPQDPQQQKTNPAAPAGATAPQNDTPPSTGTWLKLDARDPEAEAAEEAYRKESARVRRGVWIGNFVALVLCRSHFVSRRSPPAMLTEALPPTSRWSSLWTIR